MARNDKPKKESKGKDKQYPAHLKRSTTGFQADHSTNTQKSQFSAAHKGDDAFYTKPRS
jgi:hypothetical protein